MGSERTGIVGARAEQAAFLYLQGNGLKPLARNFRCRGGEIDLIMMDGTCLVFIEVRYRASNRFASASHTVDHRKQRKIIRTAAMFLARHHYYSNHTMRFDVVAVEGDDGISVDWIRDAFRPTDATL